VAFWQPGAPLLAGRRADFSYRLRFTAEPLDDSLARVVATRTGKALQDESQRSVIIDFKGAGKMPDDLRTAVSNSAGKVLDARGERLTQDGVYRVSFELDPGREDLIELRVTVMSKDEPWSESWLYQWTR